MFQNLKFNQLIFVPWLFVVALYFLAENKGKTVLFDEEGNLEFLIDTVETLSKELNSSQRNVAIINLVRENCACNRFSRKHVERVERVSENRGYFYESLIIDNMSEYKSLSTPALAVLHGNKLTYLGPYAEGAMCSENSQFIEMFLKPEPLLTNIGPTLFSTAYGCYCSGV